MIDLIIPCYNEAARFNKNLFFSYFEELENVHYIFVNDGSTDSTKELLDNLKLECKARNPEIPFSILNLKENVGKAEAVRQGVLFALKSTETEYVAYFDADFSTPLTEIDNLLQAIKTDNRRKAVLGSRIKKAGSVVERSQIRHYTGRIFATLVNNTILQIAIYDTQCGAKLFTKDCAKKIFNEPFVSRWLFDIELISRLQLIYPSTELNGIIYEQPLETWKEMGSSKIRFTDLLRMPYQLFRIHQKQKNDFQKNLGSR